MVNWGHELRRTAGFLRVLLKSKMAILGIIILVLFGFLSIAAPVLTPYDPQGDVVAGNYAYPSWYRYFSEGRLLSLNQALESNPGFKTDPFQQGWQFKTNTSLVSASFDPNTSASSGSGSVKLTLDRSSGPLSGSYSVTFLKTFNWTYLGPPARFLGSLSVKTPDATPPPEPLIFGVSPPGGQLLQIDTKLRFVANSSSTSWISGEPVIYDSNADGVYSTGRYHNDTLIVGGPQPVNNTALSQDPKINYVDKKEAGFWSKGDPVVYDNNGNGIFDRGEPVRVVVFIERLTSDRKKWVITDDTPDNSTAEAFNTSWSGYPLTGTNWQSPQSLDSLDPAIRSSLGLVDLDPSALMFSSVDQYAYGVTVTFSSNSQSTKPMNVYLDDLNIKLLGTAWGPLGTDTYGYDIWSQLIYGARISLAVGLLAAVIGIVLGLVVGLMAGYMGRVVDEVLMRFTDMLLVIPGLPLLIVLVAIIGNSLGPGRLPALIIIIGFLGWMGFARVVRAQVLSLKERPFVEAAKAAGAGSGHITTRHIIPNIVGLIYVNLALAVPGAILSEAALSFLGLGDVTVLSWGRMLNLVEVNGAQQIWWWVVPPGLCIALVSLAFVMIGFSLDTLFNPRLRQRR